MCLLIDNSGSMSDSRAEVRAAGLALVKELTPRDEVCIVDFSDEVYLDLSFTSDPKATAEALTHYESRGGKAMRDAVGMSLDYIRQKAQNGRKVLVLITEGYDTSSSVTQDRLLDVVKSSGVPIYVIGLLSQKYPTRANEIKPALDQLAEASQGSVYFPRDLAEIESVSTEIANKIRRQ